MQPFFLYYGGKWRLAERLGPPQRDHVIEPFAGSAGYSCFWEPKKVTLIERDPVVHSVWKFLQKASPSELSSDVDELPSRVCQEAKSLIGFWFNHGLPSPAVRRSNWVSIGVGSGPQIGIQKGPPRFAFRTISVRPVGAGRGCGDGASAG
jgi:hypothetical protein